jgi:hypothetical protein
MLALGQKPLEPRLRVRGGVGARHPDDVEALLARETDQPGLGGGGLDRRDRIFGLKTGFRLCGKCS